MQMRTGRIPKKRLIINCTFAKINLERKSHHRKINLERKEQSRKITGTPRVQKQNKFGTKKAQKQNKFCTPKAQKQNKFGTKKAHLPIFRRTTPKGLNVNSPRWNLGFLAMPF
jgi:hypothetical protein